MRRGLLRKGEYYHIYNRGIDKRPIFLQSRDYERFILTMFAFRDACSVQNITRIVKIKKPLEQRYAETEARTGMGRPLVEVVGFCLMPNHFHFVLKEVMSGGISKFMQRISISHTRYLNKKHDRTGYLFGSGFHSIRITDNAYLLQLSRYIHRNPTELGWGGRLPDYPWSSYGDYVGSNRWGAVLSRNIVLGQFQSIPAYKKFVEDS